MLTFYHSLPERVGGPSDIQKPNFYGESFFVMLQGITYQWAICAEETSAPGEGLVVC